MTSHTDECYVIKSEDCAIILLLTDRGEGNTCSSFLFDVELSSSNRDENDHLWRHNTITNISADVTSFVARKMHLRTLLFCLRDKFKEKNNSNEIKSMTVVDLPTTLVWSIRWNRTRSLLNRNTWRCTRVCWLVRLFFVVLAGSTVKHLRVRSFYVTSVKISSLMRSLTSASLPLMISRPVSARLAFSQSTFE